MAYEVDITIIGAGVVGLAIAAQVAGADRRVLVLEKNDTFGMETSSRHSGVIHAGIYYPYGSLKARMCVSGNGMLFQLCEKHNIAHRKLGKLIVAATDDDAPELAGLLEQGNRNGVNGLRILSRREMRELEPNVNGVAAIFSPSTGIIDAYALMRFFVARATDGGARIGYRTKVVGIERAGNRYRILVKDGATPFSFVTGVLVNSAGLYSDMVAEMGGVDISRAGYRLHYCKGEYFTVGGGKNRLVRRLIYPVPPRGGAGAGIHVVLDLDGRMRLGPSVRYVDTIDYSVDDSNRILFFESAKQFLPFIEYEDLEPEMAGVRPKLQGPGEGIRDFVIRDEADRGLPGFINLIGIESPGLTACPAIADYVGNMIDGMLGR